MAKFTKKQLKLFIENNDQCEINGLIEWIAELLPQQDFDDYMRDITLENEEE
jgi:hypothetical protein